MSSDTLQGWGIVELMGHQRTAGRLSERSIAGSNLLQVDVPVNDTEFRTVFYGGAAIYALHPTDEASARLMARSLGQRPVYSYELERQVRLEAPKPVPPGAPSPPDPFDEPDEDLDDDESRSSDMHRNTPGTDVGVLDEPAFREGNETPAFPRDPRCVTQRPAITLSANAEPYLVLGADGTLWCSPKLKPDEAARKFLEELAGLYPQWLRAQFVQPAGFAPNGEG